MKRSRVKIIALSLLVVYTMAAALLCSYGYDLYAQKEMQQDQGIEKFHSVMTGSLPGAALQPGRLAEANTSHLNTENKNSISEVSTLLRSADHFISNSFTQYTSLSANLPSRFYKTIIIFPFHYFW